MLKALSSNQISVQEKRTLVKYLGASITLGTLAYWLYKRYLRRKYRFPVEIRFDKNGDASLLGHTKEKFMVNLEKNHELYLLYLQRIYPNECTLNLGRFSLFSWLFGRERKIIFLNSIDSIKRFLSAEKGAKVEPIANRPRNYIFRLISKGFLGSFFRMYDEKLLEVRNNSLRGLHQLIGDKKGTSCCCIFYESAWLSGLRRRCWYLRPRFDSLWWRIIFKNVQ